MNKIVIFLYFFSVALVAKSQTADFTYSTNNGLFCSPSTIQFTQTSTGSPTGFVWNFGNVAASNQPNPIITFKNAGSYTVKLIAIYGQTTSVVTKTIVINPVITASIGYDRSYICAPGTINFTASSSGNINAFNWDFGDGSGIVTSNTNSIPHNFAALGTYNVKLLATDVTGCFDTTKTTINVQVPPITGSVSPTSGCVPANVSFNANVTVPVGSSVKNYKWDFGDGSPIVTTINNTTNHTYTLPGNFSPVVTIVTYEGCTNTYNFARIGFGIPPTNQVAYAEKTTICGSETAQFVAKATNANTYYYNFGDSSSLSISDTIAGHKFKRLGTKSVYILPMYNGCYSNPITVQINIIGVIANFNYSNTCTDKKTFSFTNTSQGNLSTVSWDFGDGSPIVHTINATHTFPASGTFVTKLSVTDSLTGCADTYSQNIYTSDPVLLNPDTSVCKNALTTFTVVNNYNNSTALYTWFVDGEQGGPFKDSSFLMRTSNFGSFSNYVIINNGLQYCQDTIRLNHPLLVRGPDLSFTAPSSICLNSLYNVTNTSKPFIPADSVNLWYWNFGVTNVNDSVYQPQPFVYSNPGTYDVQLTGIDKNGCEDTLVKKIIVNPLPFLYVIPHVDTLCAGTMDTLLAFHSDSIRWSPSNSLTCATCDTTLTSATTDTKYYVKATSQFGCTVSDSIMVKAYPPFTAVPAATDAYICLNDTIHLNVDPPGKKIQWSPADGLSGTNTYGPVARPSQTTTYTARLTDSVGCFTSSTNITVHVKSRPAVDAGPDQFLPYNSSFSINPTYSSNVASYNWTPGNLLSCTTCPDPNGVVSSSNTFFIKVTSDSGCVASDSIHIYIQCQDSYLLMPNAFTPNGDNLNDYFYPLTRGIKTILRFSIYDRYGHLVYEARNFPPNSKTYGWNGRVSGADQTTSVFVYYLEALCDVGDKLYKKGSVVLIR
ncbi:PKD domain-containing protein [Ginsengibacter hankyongi]|uniref:PKD domain-containing protein n=1 Tax=Ginsengibacter hankyongi TaxID=2607284 RepID=A0A5J5IPK9_9BACT|nr:PKD domain-containing protein [Ginsengibacter hankyongi]KAA9041452.1 PKD domain-containing protein [Ginsengibacter hankyongi]